MHKFKKGKGYTYTEIEKQVEDSFGNDYNLSELGDNRIGINYLIVHDEETDSICSFMLSSATSIHSIYECIYNDWK